MRRIIRRSEAHRQCTQAKVHRYLALLAAVPGSALYQHGRSTGMLEMRPLRLMLALPRAGLHGRQYARAVDPGLREILRPNRNSLGKSAQEASRARPNYQFQPG